MENETKQIFKAYVARGYNTEAIEEALVSDLQETLKVQYPEIAERDPKAFADFAKQYVKCYLEEKLK